MQLMVCCWCACAKRSVARRYVAKGVYCVTCVPHVFSCCNLVVLRFDPPHLIVQTLTDPCLVPVDQTLLLLPPLHPPSNRHRFPGPEYRLHLVTLMVYSQV